jgi:hypothetical protein
MRECSFLFIFLLILFVFGTFGVIDGEEKSFFLSAWWMERRNIAATLNLSHFSRQSEQIYAFVRFSIVHLGRHSITFHPHVK